MKRFATRAALLTALSVTGGCAGTEPVLVVEPEPLAALPAPEVEPEPEVAPEPVRAPEPPLLDRWRAPFAVTSSGAVQPRVPRGVTVLGAEQAAAGGGAGTRVAAAGPGGPTAGASGSANRPPASGTAAVPSAAAAGSGSTRTPPPPSAGPNPSGAPSTNSPASRIPAEAPAPAGRSAPGAPGPTPSAPAASPGSRTPPPPSATSPAGTSAPRASGASASTPAAPLPAEGPRARTYRVEPGDSWLRIAIDHGVSYSQLAASNPGVEPDRIRIGQILQIPQEETSSARRSHRVGPGDTLWGIARRYEVSPESLRAANGLSNDRIRQGQVLVIPPAGGE